MNFGNYYEAATFYTRPTRFGALLLFERGQEMEIENWQLKSKKIRQAPNFHVD
jgi:hypothetical protein